MILYNTLMGWAAALVLLTLAGMLWRYNRGDRMIPAGTAIVLVVTGSALTFLSGLMAVTWPLTVNRPINIAFAEPCLILGLFALVGGLVALARPGRLDEGTRSLELAIGAVGLPLLAIALAIFRFNLVGDAPPIEPITGQIHGWENTTFGLVYLTAAVACFLTAARKLRAAAVAFAVVGVFFLVFASLNYYTHIGMLVNAGTGSDYRW